MRTCQQCGCDFDPQPRQRKFCLACRPRRQWLPLEPELAACPGCCVLFVRTHRRQQWCTTDCWMKAHHRKPHPGGKTTDRGYGSTHQRMRRQLLAVMNDGDPCCLCDRPMYKSESLDLDHTPDRGDYRGLAHARCNRQEGVRRSNARRRALTLGVGVSESLRSVPL